MSEKMSENEIKMTERQKRQITQFEHVLESEIETIKPL